MYMAVIGGKVGDAVTDDGGRVGAMLINPGCRVVVVV